MLSVLCRRAPNRRSPRAKGDLFSKHLGACWGKPFMLTQQWQVSVSQLNSSSLQQTVQYLLDPQEALGISLGPRVGMAQFPIWRLLWGRLGMRLGMRLRIQELKRVYSVMVFCQQVGSTFHPPPPPSVLPPPSTSPVFPFSLYSPSPPHFKLHSPFPALL